MKFLCFIICVILFNNQLRAQGFRFIANDYPAYTPKPLFFHSSLNDTGLNTFVFSELQALSDFFMLKTNCYFVDTLKENSVKTTLSDYKSENIFFDAARITSNYQSASENITIVNIIAHRYAETVIKKYKLDIPDLQKLFLADYLSGYYMACRFRVSKNLDKTQVITLDNLSDQNLVDMRGLAFEQGKKDFIFNYRQRKTFTLLDLLQAGLEFTDEPL